MTMIVSFLAVTFLAMVANAATPQSAADIAGNEQVREHVKKFTPRGETVETGRNIKALTPEESLSKFNLPPDLEISLAIAEPDVRQPVCLNFDERGRMWVVQYLQYPFPAGLKIVKYDEHLRAVFDKVPPPPPNHFPGADKVTIYEDRDGDGRFESKKDFVTGLSIATSALPGKDGVWVMNPPYLLFYPDKNGDDIPDGPPEVHLSGFGLEDTHAVANSLTWGPDGWLYGAQGSTCTATVKGIRFLGQAIWRYHPATGEFEIFAEGGGNTFCIEFDRKGRLYSGTNWGNQRGLYFVQGGYYVKGWGKHGPLTNPHAYGFFNHMPHAGDEARFSHSFIIYEGNNLPEKYHERMFALVPLHNRVQLTELKPDGSSYKTVDLERVVTTEDKWFRPVDIKAGPDGGVYLADWYDVRLTHVDPRDNWDKSNGRIYKIQRKDSKKVPALDMRKLSSDKLVDLLSHSNKWHRQQALQLLGQRGDKSILKRLKQLVADNAGDSSLNAFWAIHLLGGLDDQFAIEQLKHPDEHIRTWSARLIGDRKSVSRTVLASLTERAKDEYAPQVRSQLASTAKRLPASAGLLIVEELVRSDKDVKDPHIPLLTWWAVESKAVSDRDQVLRAVNKPGSSEFPLISKEIVPRLVKRYGSEGTESALNAISEILDSAPSEARKPLLQTLAEAFKGHAPASVPPSLRKIIQENAAGQENQMVALRMRLGMETPGDLELIENSLANWQKGKTNVLVEQIELTGQLKISNAIPALLEIAREAKHEMLRSPALQALQFFDDARVGVELVKIVNVAREKSPVIDLLSRRKSWSDELLRAIENNTLSSTNVPFEVVQRIYAHRDETLANRAAKLWPAARRPSRDLQNSMDKISKVLKAGTGDADKGKIVFTANCAACHKLFGEGQNIGPDLTGYERSNLDFLLLAVVDPNAAIREEYTNFELATTEGLLLSGFIVERGADSVTIEDGEGGRLAIPKSKIKTLQASPVSRMPEGLLDPMSDQEIRDLFAYLRQ